MGLPSTAASSPSCSSTSASSSSRCWLAAAAFVGVVVTAAYLLRMLRRSCSASLPRRVATIDDAPPLRFAPMVILATTIMVVGIFPVAVPDHQQRRRAAAREAGGGLADGPRRLIFGLLLPEIIVALTGALVIVLDLIWPLPRPPRTPAAVARVRRRRRACVAAVSTVSLTGVNETLFVGHHRHRLARRRSSSCCSSASARSHPAASIERGADVHPLVRRVLRAHRLVHAGPHAARLGRRALHDLPRAAAHESAAHRAHRLCEDAIRKSARRR